MLVLFWAFLLVAQAIPVKHLAGEPSEFPLHNVPNPANVETLQRSASRNLWFSAPDSGVLATHNFPVEGTRFVLSFASPVRGIRVELLSPSGQPVVAREEKQTFFVDDSEKDDLPVTVYIVEDAVAGVYTLNILTSSDVDSAQLTEVLNNPRPDAVLTFIVDDNVTIHSHLQSYLLRPGQAIGLVASVSATPGTDFDYSYMGVSKGVMQVTMPDGSSLEVPMHDDGVSGGDLAANDQVFSGSIIATQPGVYLLESILDGELSTIDDGNTDSFERTAQHIVAVTASTVELAGKAFLRAIDQERVLIEMVVLNAEAPQPRLRAYSEVWGTTADGSLKAVCWIGGLVEVRHGTFIGLELNVKWLELAGVSGPLYLKNTYISDMDTNFPVSVSTSEIHIQDSTIFPHHWGLAANYNITITKVMREGRNPLKEVIKAVEGVPDLLLLPGYCSDVNPWSRSASSFTNGFFPVDRGNYSNQRYAEKILAQVEAQGMTRYGVIAHSQGGMVGTHIHNYLWSGIESASGGKKIQSVGTPYQGNTAAGSAANLGEVFGVGCGSNTDLSRDGAVNWLSGISSSARANVHFYTTSYKQGTWFGDYCSLPMNLVLQWPNDGVTENTYASLTGGNFQSNTEQWCHSTEMGYPPQYEDATRNRAMNSAAAR